MKRRSILFKRSIAIALLVSLMLLQFNVFSPKVEATYTYVVDDTYSQMGWMDVKQIGWDFTPKELHLKVQHQTNIPNSPDHAFGGDFFLDTTPGTGDPSGFDYYLAFYYVGDGGSFSCKLWRYDTASQSYMFVKDLSKPFFLPGGDTVELGVPLSDIGSPTTIKILYLGFNDLIDYIKRSYAYNTASEERSIMVDGNPADWGADAPDVTDATGDATPGLADATKFYTTDSAGKLYIRMDLAATPPSLHPEAVPSAFTYMVDIYFDTDQNPVTGPSIGGIGAEYTVTCSVATQHTSRSLSCNLRRWTGTSWTSVSGATFEKAFATCLELSLLLSDIGVTGSAMDIYISDVIVINSDVVPDPWPSSTFTATKVALPSRRLNEASTQILSAAANTVYFIYSDPYRMVSPTAPWAAAFAAYDATAAGFIYGLCANVQKICYDSDGSIVVAKAPEASPPFNYGKVLLSAKRIVVMGGPIPNWVVDYYERTGHTPLKYNKDSANPGFATQAGVTVASLPATTDFVHNDLFVVMAFEDIRSNFVLIIYGLGWKGTFAGGVFFKEVISPYLGTFIGNAYVFRWQDGLYGNPFDGVPQVDEIYAVYPHPLVD